MVMCVSNQDKSVVKVLDPPTDSKPGDIVQMDGMTNINWDSGAKKLMKVMDQTKDTLRTNLKGEAVFDGKYLKVNNQIMNNEIKEGYIS